MQGQDRFNRFIERYPHSHPFPVTRAHATRREFFQVLGAGFTGSFLAGRVRAGEVISQASVQTQNRAKNVIFILLAGGPTHVDLFDLKVINGVTPATFNPTSINGIDWPVGLMPKLAQHLPDLAIVRSVKSWALQHQLGQVWTQIGRNPAAALGDIAPNIGSVVAAEKERERLPGQVFPTFLALNSGGAVGSGYLPAIHSPLKIDVAAAGLPDTSNPDGPARLDTRIALLNTLDGVNRVKSQYARTMEDYDGFYKAARGLCYNPAVDAAFRFTTAESATYGNSGFGNACLTAAKATAANLGTRFILITSGGWDDHQNIYAANALPARSAQLDNGLSQLIADLKASGRFTETLIVMMGEFGRTVGPLTGQGGRDHFLQQFVLFAGGGVRGGRAIGATSATGSTTSEAGWSRDRDVRVEDIEATIYSALGINWTTTRYDDPFGRGFDYVPFSKDDLYGPINELWA